MSTPPPPLCPRCAYDLSGEVARWERQCPLGGRCSECGLEFDWADVVSERLRPPAWSFEHARDRWGRRLPRAWRISLDQKRCWQALRLEHRVVPRRLILSIVLMSLLLWVGLGVATSLMLASQTRAWWGFRVIGGLPVHASSEPGLLEIAWTEHRDALLNPLCSLDASQLTLYRGPLIGAWMASLAAATVAMPLALFLLPQTFRRTRVRRAHLLRAATYTITGPAVLLLLGAGAIAWSADEEYFAHAWLLTLLGLYWLVSAWRSIIRDYLRLPHHRAVWLAMSVIGLLAGAVAGALMLPGEMHHYRWVWYL